MATETRWIMLRYIYEGPTKVVMLSSEKIVLMEKSHEWRTVKSI